MASDPKHYSDPFIIQTFDFEHVPLGEEIWLMDEQWMKELGSAVAKNDGVFDIGYVTKAVVHSIGLHALELSIYLNHVRFREIRASLSRDQFVIAVDRPEYDIKPRVFVKGGWLADLHLRNHSIFAIFDVIGIRDALEQLGHIVNTAGSYLRAGKADPPWTVSIDDLDVIVEMFDSSAEFLHYIRRRQVFLADTRVHNPDEIGFLETYLRESLPADTERFKGYTHVLLEAASPKIDGYRNAKAQGVEKARPLHKIPTEIRLLLDKLAEQRPVGWLDASIAILDLILAPSASFSSGYCRIAEAQACLWHYEG